MLLLILLAPVATAIVIGVFENRFRHQAEFGNESAEQGKDLDVSEQRRFSLLAESLVYVGVLLVLTGSTIVTQQRWLRITNPERAVILASAALVLLIAGYVVRWVTSWSAQRAPE